MITRMAGASRALGAALRTLAALQASLAGQLPALPLALVSPTLSSSYDISPVPRWQRAAARWFSVEPAAAAEDARSTVEYRIDIVTGDVRGAGSAAAAVIVLIGEDGESEPFMIGGGDEEASSGALGFERATRQSYRLYSGRDLGQLRRLYVRQLPASTVTGAGWFLDRVEVTGPGGERWTFPCGSWLGRSDAGDDPQGAVMERTLLPVDLAALSSFEARQFVNLNPLFAPIQVASSGLAVPHPEKVATGLKGVNKKGYGYAGEDAYFYAGNRNGVYAMGVSDGVYAWREKGIDAGAYSQKLMEYARLSVSMGTTDVLRVVQYAAKRVQREHVKGSATCCVVLIDMLQGRMASANLGDSGVIVIGPRDDSSSEWPVYVPPGAKAPMVIKYRSPQQEHTFGRPYQLGHHEYADSADDAMLSTMPVGPGDVIVLGSDGLFDNVSEEEIRSEVERAVHAGHAAPAVAQRLTQLAFDYSLDKHRETPYSLGATEAFDMIYSGGKADDITVLCAMLS